MREADSSSHPTYVVDIITDRMMDIVRCVWVLALFQLIEVRLIDSQISLLPKESDTVMPG